MSWFSRWKNRKKVKDIENTNELVRLFELLDQAIDEIEEHIGSSESGEVSCFDKFLEDVKSIA